MKAFDREVREFRRDFFLGMTVGVGGSICIASILVAFVSEFARSVMAAYVVGASMVFLLTGLVRAAIAVRQHDKDEREYRERRKKSEDRILELLERDARHSRQ